MHDRGCWRRSRELQPRPENNIDFTSVPFHGPFQQSRSEGSGGIPVVVGLPVTNGPQDRGGQRDTSFGQRQLDGTLSFALAGATVT